MDNSSRPIAVTTGGSTGTYNETYGYDSATGNLASKGNTTNTLTYLANANSCRVFDANGNITTGSHSIAHAVSAFGSNIYSYDCNGNQTTRTVNGQTFNLSYDAENRLVSVSGAVTASFVYVGDGRQVKAVVGSITTYYVGAYYQVDNGVVNKYYFAGAQRVAMRKGSTLSYLLGDHLGSTSLATNTSGTLVSELRYKPWGETRYTSGTTPTNYQFTGQRNEVSIGLYFYNARWYDSTTGRFAQADTILPQNQGVHAWDRYGYANNSPVNYIDPSGHMVENGDDGGCYPCTQLPKPPTDPLGCGVECSLEDIQGASLEERASWFAWLRNDMTTRYGNNLGDWFLNISTVVAGFIVTGQGSNEWVMNVDASILYSVVQGYSASITNGSTHTEGGTQWLTFFQMFQDPDSFSNQSLIQQWGIAERTGTKDGTNTYGHAPFWSDDFGFELVGGFYRNTQAVYCGVNDCTGGFYDPRITDAQYFGSTYNVSPVWRALVLVYLSDYVVSQLPWNR